MLVLLSAAVARRRPEGVLPLHRKTLEAAAAEWPAAVSSRGYAVNLEYDRVG
jgi:hypothetical protein